MNDSYIAGLFDGEGSVGIYRTNNGKKTVASGKRKYWAASLSISGTHRPMIEELVKHMPGASFVGDTRIANRCTPTKHYSQGHCRPSFKAQITRRCYVEAFLRRVRPFLWEKAEQADIVLQYISGEIGGEVASVRCKKAKRFVFANTGAVSVRKRTSDRPPCANDSITMDQARSIRNRVANGERPIDVSRQSGVSAAIICNITKGRSYRERGVT